MRLNCQHKVQKFEFVWENGHEKIGRFYLTKTRRPQTIRFFQELCLLLTNAVPVKKWARKLFERRRNKINTISKIFDFHEYDYNSAVNTYFWAWSNFISFANFVPLITNDGALEPSQQRKFVLGLLAGGKNNYKINNLVQDKQTLSLSINAHLNSTIFPDLP